MTTTYEWRIPFNDEDLWDFLDELRNVGYIIGMEQFISIKLLLVRLADKDALPANPHELSRYIGPLLSSSPRQQEEFQRMFDIWIGPLIHKKGQKSREHVSVPKEDPSTLEYELRALRKRNRIFLLAIISTLILTLGVLMFLIDFPPNKTQTGFIIPGTGLAGQPIFKLISADEVLIFAVPFVTVIIFLLFGRRRFLSRRYQSQPPNLDNLSVSGLSTDGWIPPIHKDVAVRMRHRESFEDEELDVEKTVEACVATAGIFSPVYVIRSRIPDYLVLIERSDQDDLRAVRIDAIVAHLVKEGVLVDVYYFDQDPRRVDPAKKAGESLSLVELQSRHPYHRMIVCSEAESFVSAMTGLPHHWLSLFQFWENLSLLTLKPVVDWGTRERTLSSAGFKLLPSNPDGFGAVADVRFAQQIINDAMSFQPPRYPDSLAQDEEIWIDSNEPSTDQVHESLVDVYDYLGETGYSWLASCAVYPEIKPALTLYLGERVASPYQASIMERLARLPWMRYAYMPDWLRRALLGGLSRRRERTVRAMLRALLMLTKDFGSGLTFDIEQRNFANLARLWRRHSHGWKRQVNVGEPLKDRVFIAWMDDRLSLRIPRALVRWLHVHHIRRDQFTSDNLSSDTAHYYQEQHIFPLRGIAILIFGLIVCAAIGIGYGWISNYLESWYGEFFNLVVFFFTLFCLLFVSWGIIREGRIRGAWFGLTIGFLCGLVSLYANWQFWLVQTLDFAFFYNPIEMSELLVNSANNFSGPNWYYYILWFLEFSIIMATCIFFSYLGSDTPFCPLCQTWVERQERTLGPLDDEALAIRDILYGRYTRFFALSRTPPDKFLATVATLEYCDPTCASTTLITLNSITSDRSALGELLNKQDKPLVERLFVPINIARDVYQWIETTVSVRPNVVPHDQPDLYRIVGELLKLKCTNIHEFYVYGDIPVEKAEYAKEKLGIPIDVPIVALAVKETWFIFTFYSVYAFSEEGIYAYHTASKFTAYPDVDDSDFEDVSKVKEKYAISFDAENARTTILSIKKALSTENVKFV